MKRKLTPPCKLCAIVCGMSLFFSSSFAQTKVDLGSISKNNNSVKYVAIGSSLSAGVRDGGVYAEAQQTSFPALLAQQMGIKDFKQPLLEGNGTGRKTVSLDKNGVLKFAETKGLDDKSPNAQLPKVVGEVDNLAVPYLKVMSLGLAEEETKDWLPSFSKKEFIYLNRIVDSENENKLNYHKTIDKQLKQIDFFTYEVGMNDFVELFNSGAYLQDISFLTFDREGYFPEDEVLKLLQKKGGKGVIANVPEILKFPFYNIYTYRKLSENLGKQIFIQRYNKNDIRMAQTGDLFLPTNSINSVLEGSISQGLSIEEPILDEDVIGVEEYWSVKTYNKWLELIAKQNSLPVVDLYSLYEKILGGNYTTEDGVLVNPKYPQGNFFSSDGITPTAFGQAIVANEFIKVINSTYGAQIPFIATKTYLIK